jgi:hypothetical protein
MGWVAAPGSVRPDNKSYKWVGISRVLLEAVGAQPVPLPWLFRTVFNARERRQLAGAGIDGPNSFEGLPLANGNALPMSGAGLLGWPRGVSRLRTAHRCTLAPR